MVARSPLLGKAACFAKMLKDDNEAIRSVIDGGGECGRFDIETLDGDDAEVIEMTLELGVLEARVKEHTCAPPDPTPMPTEWRKADQ